MNDKQAQLAADDAAITTAGANYYATLAAKFMTTTGQLEGENIALKQEIEQLEAIVNGLNKRVNLAEWNAARVAEQLEAAAESAAYWRGRCLAAEMQEHEAQWWEG